MTPSRRVSPLDTGPIYDELKATATEVEEHMIAAEDMRQDTLGDCKKCGAGSAINGYCVECRIDALIEGSGE